MENLTKGTIEERVKELIAANLGLDLEEVVNDATLADGLGADSLDTVEIIMELEKEFNIVISDDVAEDLKTVKQHIDVVTQLYTAEMEVDLSNENTEGSV
jgi:acyl carrier protein